MKKLFPVFLVTSVLTSLSAAGCGNLASTDHLQGRVGFVVGPEQQIILRVNPCGLNINEIRISGGAEQMGDYTANPTYLILHSPEQHPEPFDLDLGQIDSPWTMASGQGLPENPGKVLLVTAGIQDEIDRTGQTSAYVGDIWEVPPGMVQVGIYSEERQLITEEEFLRCN